MLDSFLLDHDRERIAFAHANYNYAVHLEGQLPKSWKRDDTGEEYEVKKINEDGHGVKLKVFKKKMELQTLQEWWRRRRDRAKNLVEKMDKERQLRRLLGEEYDELVGKFACE